MDVNGKCHLGSFVGCPREKTQPLSLQGPGGRLRFTSFSGEPPLVAFAEKKRAELSTPMVASSLASGPQAKMWLTNVDSAWPLYALP